MRLRKVKNALDKLKAYPSYFINSPEEYKGKWSKVFKNSQPIHIEIGCGKGQFITQLAQLNPDINYLAIEKYDSVLLRAAERLDNLSLPNLRLILWDASKIEEIFAENEISQIYINFSDPWPKSAHKKRRLTYKTFLESYEKILIPEGKICQKTDNRKFFAFSIESFNENQWLLSNITLDLHADEEFNIQTEFEEKWSKLGPIYRLEATKRR